MKNHKNVSLGIFASHPVQYHVPIWRHLSKNDSVNSRVFYFSDHGATEQLDPGFGVEFRWDLDLLGGYQNEFLSKQPLSTILKARVPDLRKLVHSKDIGCVLLHGYTQRFSRQILANKRRLGYGVILRGEFCDTHNNRLGLKRFAREIYLKWFYSQVDAFCFIGRNSREHLLRRGISNDRLFFSPYSVDSDFFESESRSKSRESRRQNLGIQEGQLVALFSGKMIERKQPKMLVELAKRFAEDERFVLIMLGDGPLFNDIKSELKEHIDVGRAILPGFVNQSQLGDYFGASDLFLFPSQYETWGLVVNEAMHFGLPCFVSDQVGCGPDLIVQGETGNYFDCCDVQAIYNLVLKGLNSRQDIARMGRNAKIRIAEYSSENSAKGISQALEYVRGFRTK
jgi:glycosyltransferase involved in cell wall biosynthesis